MKPGCELWIWNLQAGVKNPSSDTHWSLCLNLVFCKEDVTLYLPHRIMDVNFGE